MGINPRLGKEGRYVSYMHWACATLADAYQHFPHQIWDNYLFIKLYFHWLNLCIILMLHGIAVKYIDNSFLQYYISIMKHGGTPLSELSASVLAM